MAAGNYVVTIQDNNWCMKTVPYTITEPSDPLAITSQITNNTCNNTGDASISLLLSGGTITNPPFVSWTPSAGGSVVVTGLTASSNTVVVYDDNLCSATETF